MRSAVGTPHPRKAAVVWRSVVISQPAKLKREHFALVVEQEQSARVPFEDIAVIVDESVKAETIEALIKQTGGRSVTNVRLFDLYRDEKIGEGKKSLAYALTYQAEDKTMTDADAAAIRNKIVKRLEKEVGAKLRS